MFKGMDIITVGSSRIGQAYVLGANVPLDKPTHNGPWDCAEFASWCVYQAYEGMRFGFKPVGNIAHAEPYSGHWYDQALKQGRIISVKTALKIAGAVLIRKPGTPYSDYGHVAFCVGDGAKTLEARSTAFGVGIFDAHAGNRPWTIACLLPGIDYEQDGEPPIAAPPKTPDYGPGYLWLKMPPFKGADVLALQEALVANGQDPGTLDGEFGPHTQSAVINFQIVARLSADGIVGPLTAKALGLGFPIAAAARTAGLYQSLVRPAPVAPVSLVAPGGGIDGVVNIRPVNGRYFARAASGVEFCIGKPVNYSDDGLLRRGLQNVRHESDALIGYYRPTDYTGQHKEWAYLITPSIIAEGNGFFGTINTYDRAAFTFGAPQFAAHTPKRNFITYLHALAGLNTVAGHFPELSLRPNAKGEDTVHLTRNGVSIDLEKVQTVTRPNGKSETQLVELMRWLNPDPKTVDPDELSAAARLMNWVRIDPEAKALQIKVFIEHANENLQTAKTRTQGAFTGKIWQQSVWILDILHHGRGSYKSIATALNAPVPLAALQAIGGPGWAGRGKKVAKAIAEIENGGHLDGFTV